MTENNMIPRTKKQFFCVGNPENQWCKKIGDSFATADEAFASAKSKVEDGEYKILNLVEVIGLIEAEPRPVKEIKISFNS